MRNKNNLAILLKGWPQGQTVGVYPMGGGLEPSDAFSGVAAQASLTTP